ncbi:MAG: sigma-70 family RNA polymerase sigma factor [Thermodesulfobacteriota bacterium]
MSSNQNYDLSRFSGRDKELFNLLVQISEGSQQALKTFYDLTSGLVFGLAIKMLSITEEAEEVVMDIYKNVWNNADKYDPERSSPMTWLLLVTRSRCIDSIRSNSKRFSTEVKKDEDFITRVKSAQKTPEQFILHNENREVIKEALSNLNENHRRTIELAYFLGYTQTEIAEEMGQPLGTIKSWARMGLIKLRDVMLEVDT